MRFEKLWKLISNTIYMVSRQHMRSIGAVNCRVLQLGLPDWAGNMAQSGNRGCELRSVSDIQTQKYEGSRGLRSDGVRLRMKESEKYKLGLNPRRLPLVLHSERTSYSLVRCCEALGVNPASQPHAYKCVLQYITSKKVN